MIHGLFRNVLFSFQVFRDFPVMFLLLMSSLILLWLNILYIISFISSLLKLVLGPMIWSTLVYLLWAFEKKLYRHTSVISWVCHHCNKAKITIKSHTGTSLVVQWLRLRVPNAGGSIPGQGTRFCMLQLRAHMTQLKEPACCNEDPMCRN